MAERPIQAVLGEGVMQVFADFARAELKPTDALEREEFSHVHDERLRQSLAKVLYGVRWIYKLGVALLVRDEERAAHVRAQLVDYASVCEGLLSYSVAHAIRRGHAKGDAYNWADPDKQLRPLNWRPSAPEVLLSRQSLWWLIRVAREFEILDTRLAKELDWLREQRNEVHLRQRDSVRHAAFLEDSKRAFNVVVKTIRQTKVWKATRP